jgi:Carboxypeptidase regulatory-like domain
MTTLFGPILAVALLAQLQGGTIQGKVVDDQSKPVEDAQIIFFAPPPREGGVDPVDVQTTSNTAGQFRLTSPPLGRFAMNGVHVWAYRSGSAITAVPSYLPPLDLVLKKPAPRFIKVEGPDGRPVAGAIVSPRVVFVADGNAIAEMPDSLATALAVTTGPDGNAPLAYLQNQDQLVAVRVTADAIGGQDFPLIEVPRRDPQAATITIRLGATSRFTGRVRTRVGEPVAGQTVEVWFKGGTWLPANPVVFGTGPLRTAVDGSFHTLDNLMVGSAYRVVVRAPDMEPILSDWITIGEKPRVLLPMIQRPLRTISGRVVDRQGRPVAGIEIFQSGDGPERTATKGDAEGRFRLGGFRQGPVFLFARGEGFRFFGQLIKSGDDNITVELTRTGERPAREMRMLPEAVSEAESRALARRLMEPYWQAAVAQKNSAAADRALRYLAAADPVGVLQKLDAAEFANSAIKPMIQVQVARALAQTDPKQAQEVAEAIATPANRANALLSIVDALAPEEHDGKLAVLNRATLHARDTKRAYPIANVAERWYELGEKERAKALLAECLLLRKEPSILRGQFAARLASVDLEAALAIAKEFPATGRNSASSVFRNIALRLAADNPAEAERVMRLVPQEKGRYWLPPAIAWKMAAVDPARARKLVDESQRYYDHPQAYLFLALGLKLRDPVAADEAFETAMRGIDRLMKEGAEFSAMRGYRGVLLPLVEQVDPALVPELFWRAVATRPPIGNPRSAVDTSPANLVMLLGWYDRDVASALFEQVRTGMEHADDATLARSTFEFLAWSVFDPRAAVARLEQVPISPKLEPGADFARERVAEMLGLSHEERWRRIWSDYTEMRDLFERDFR